MGASIEDGQDRSLYLELLFLSKRISLSSLQDAPTLHPNSLKFRVKSSPSVTEKSYQDVQGHLENTCDRCAAASGQT